MISIQFAARYAFVAVFLTFLIKEQEAAGCAWGWPLGLGKYTIENGPPPVDDPCTYSGSLGPNFHLKWHHGFPKGYELYWLSTNSKWRTDMYEKYHNVSSKGMLDDLLEEYKRNKTTTIQITQPTTTATMAATTTSKGEPPAKIESTLRKYSNFLLPSKDKTTETYPLPEGASPGTIVAKSSPISTGHFEGDGCAHTCIFMCLSLCLSMKTITK
uniref:Spondin domain-containing protein n=1 Tax=Glossina brevipalpis TaxID=37001 RepID=A0A1A9WRX3_9MUSC